METLGHYQKSGFIFWKKNGEFSYILVGMVLVIVGVWLGGIIFGENQIQLEEKMLSYETNVFTEALSVILTVFVLDRINQWRGNQDTKKRLIREAGSRSNTVAIGAVEWLRAENWLVGDVGLLPKSLLWGANLQNVDLEGANLAEANLRDAQLQNAILIQANLTEANLRRALLQNAHLDDAHLHEADLRLANLSNAGLLRANLSMAKLNHAALNGANLHNACLCGADLSEATFSVMTVLPDAKSAGYDAEGKPLFTKYWTPNTDIRRYTDENHADFWRPDWRKNGQAVE
jgi:Pentapeptide repeats (8 copies)